MFSFSILAAARFIFLLAAVFPVDSSDPPNIVLQPITPPPSQCQPFTFQWTGGTPPFFVCLYQNGMLQRSLGPTNGSSFPWDSDFPAGTVLDATVSGSDCSLSKEPETFTVQAGPSNDCLGLPLTASSTSTGTSSTSPPPTDSQSSSVSSSHTSAPPIAPRPSAPSTPVPSASAGAQQRPPPGAGKGGRVAGIVIGCLLAIALLTALALALLRKRRRARAKARARVVSMTTSAFTATTWSDLSPPAPEPEPEPDRPHGANSGVTEWNADFFARSRSRDTSRTRPPSRVPFAMPTPGARGTGTPPGRPSTRIPKASVDVETSAPVRAAPAESEDDAPSLRSYPPLVPQTRTVSVSAVGGPLPIPGEHAYPPATVPVPVLPPVQIPLNPFRARLLAAAAARNNNGNGAGAWARSDGPEHPYPFK